MEKITKNILWIVGFVLFCIFFAINASRSNISINEEDELQRILKLNNTTYPRNIGSVGSFDSVTYNNKTLIYNFTVNGNSNIMEVYRQNYEEYKDILKYSIIVMNGQNNNGSKLIDFCEKNEINFGFHLYTQNGDVTKWVIPCKELKDFVVKYKINPTTALRKILDLNIKIANIDLPITPEKLNSSIQSVTTNTLINDYDESILPISISHEGDDIIFEYSVDEEEIDLDGIEMINGDDEILNDFITSMMESPDSRDFIYLIVLSRSNMVVAYIGRETNKKVEVYIPYHILKKYANPSKILTNR